MTIKLWRCIQDSIYSCMDCMGIECMELDLPENKRQPEHPCQRYTKSRQMLSHIQSII